MSGAAENVRLQTQLKLTRERCAALEAEIKTVRSLMWSIYVTGTGYLYKGPDGSTHALNPANVVVLIDANDVPIKERMASALARVRALADAWQSCEPVEMLPSDAASALLDCLDNYDDRERES